MSVFCDQCGAQILTPEDLGLVLPYEDRIRFCGGVIQVRSRMIVCRGCRDDAEYMLQAIAGSDAGAVEAAFNAVATADVNAWKEG